MMAAVPKLPLSLFSIMVSSLFLLSSQGLCTVTAAFLHFFFLASFCWVLTEAWQSYLAVIGKMRPRLIRKRFLCLGWGELARRLITSAKVGVRSVAGRIFSRPLYGEKRSTQSFLSPSSECKSGLFLPFVDYLHFSFHG